MRSNDGSVCEVPSKEHAGFGTGRSGLLFIENDSGAASVVIRNRSPEFEDENEAPCGGKAQATSFTNSPRGAAVILTTSPGNKVKSFGGTMPVPVNRKAPAGKLSSR